MRLTTDQRQGLKVMGWYENRPGDTLPLSGRWSMTAAGVMPTFWRLLPISQAQVWVCDPMTAGTANLKVISGNASVTVPIIITQSGAAGLTLSLLTNPDSCFAGRPLVLAMTASTPTACSTAW